MTEKAEEVKNVLIADSIPYFSTSAEIAVLHIIINVMIIYHREEFLCLLRKNDEHKLIG